MRQVKLSIKNISSCLCTFYNNGMANVMIIDNVQTKKEFQGKGYGTKLINKAIDLAKKNKVDSIELVVNKENKIAKKLYEKTGFKKTNKDYFRLILNKWTT
jgi:GNAT superfamily N-acetyltransferase